MLVLASAFGSRPTHVLLSDRAMTYQFTVEVEMCNPLPPSPNCAPTKDTPPKWSSEHDSKVGPLLGKRKRGPTDGPTSNPSSSRKTKRPYRQQKSRSTQGPPRSPPLADQTEAVTRKAVSEVLALAWQLDLAFIESDSDDGAGEPYRFKRRALSDD